MKFTPEHDALRQTWKTLIDREINPRVDEERAEDLDAILALPEVDVAAIRNREFHVALDCVRGAGGPTMLALFDRLGVRDKSLGACERHNGRRQRLQIFARDTLHGHDADEIGGAQAATESRGARCREHVI